VVVADTKRALTDEQLKLLFDSMGGLIEDSGPDAAQVRNLLITETVKFRNKILDETGEVLTVGDARCSLEALCGHLDGEKPRKDLTPEQKALFQIWIDRITLFRSS
jgi:hypothetical protein